MLLDINDYDIAPSSHTIVRDKIHDLRTLGITINTELKVAVCVDCGKGINPESISAHIKKHFPLHKPVDTLEKGP